jgi:hypothetical protein
VTGSDYLETVVDLLAAKQRLERAADRVAEAMDTLCRHDSPASYQLRYVREGLLRSAQDRQDEADRSDCPEGLSFAACTLADPCEQHRASDGSHVAVTS